MKLSSPLPQTLPGECSKAAKIFKSFVDHGNNGLDGVIPRHILERARGFAIFTVFKAGFLFSARAGSGVVIARQDDGTWSAPSAIGTAGLGVGGQLGAEMTDFLIVLNSKSAIKSFMAAGSLTLGGNVSLAIGPLGRNGEASGSLSSRGKMAAMYSYSKTRGLFGGLSVEGSVIVERQDANAQAYKSDVTAKQLLGGFVEPPSWAAPLIQTLEMCTGMPGGREWIHDESGGSRYMFGGLGTPVEEEPPAFLKKKNRKASDSAGKSKKAATFPPENWGQPTNSGSYFTSEQDENDFLTSTAATQGGTAHPNNLRNGFDKPWSQSPAEAYSPTRFETHFDSDFVPDDKPGQFTNAASNISFSKSPPASPLGNQKVSSHARSFSSSNPIRKSPISSPFHRESKSLSHMASSNPFDSTNSLIQDDSDDSLYADKPYITPKPELVKPLDPHDGVARAVALYDFNAVESGDLSFSKGDVITIVHKSQSTDDWWKGKVNGKEGIFPANFVEVV